MENVHKKEGGKSLDTKGVAEQVRGRVKGERRGGEARSSERDSEGQGQNGESRRGGRRGVSSSVRGLPNCAVSLSAIDRFASAINTGHRALATPGTHPRPPTHTPIYPSPRPCSPTRLQPPLSPPRNPLARHTRARAHTRIRTRICGDREGRETLTFKRATEGEGGVATTSPVTHLPHPRSPQLAHS